MLWDVPERMAIMPARKVADMKATDRPSTSTRQGAHIEPVPNPGQAAQEPVPVKTRATRTEPTPAKHTADAVPGLDLPPVATKNLKVLPVPNDLLQTTPAEPTPDTVDGNLEPVVAEPDPSTSDPDAPVGEGKYQQRYEEAERTIGKQGTELGDLRRMVDQHIMSPQPTAQPQAGVPEEIDFLEDPKAAIAEVVKQVVQQVNPQMATMVNQNTAHQKFVSEHPDHHTVVNSAEFTDWAVKTYPPSILAVANEDPTATSHMLTAYKNTLTPAPVPPPVDPKIVAQNITAKRQAARTTTGLTPEPKGSGDGEEVFTRADLMDMRINRPKEYERRQKEIFQAYDEGRVKT